jgi:HlyD family secretion protein
MMTEGLTHASNSPVVSTDADMDRRVEPTATPWWRCRVAAWAMLLVPVVVLVARFLPSSGSTDVVAADIDTAAVARAPFADYLPVRAMVAPKLSMLVGVLSGGHVEALLVQDGAMVAEGEALATLANPALRLDVLTREAQIAAQLGSVAGENLGIARYRLDRDGQVAQAHHDVLKARRELAIRQQLHEAGFVSEAGVKSYAEDAAYQQRRLEKLQAGHAAEARITATQGRRLADTVGRLERNMAAVRTGMDALTIRAPTDGRLTNFMIQPGQSLRPGDPAGQVDSEGSWKLTADVDEYFLRRIFVGQPASAEGMTLTVAKVLPTVHDGRFRVELALDGTPSAGLYRGQAIDIRITLGSTAPALVAPVGSWLDVGASSSVFVLDADGRHARRRPVKTGRRNPEQVEILSGLAPGERIVTSNTASVKGDVLNLR